MKKLNKAIAIFLAVVALSSVLAIPASAANSPFTDVSASNKELKEAVDYLYSLGIVTGKTSTLFKPNDKVTRGEMITMLWRIAGKPEISCSVPFTDCVSGAYYYSAVKWGVSKGIVTGCTDGTFKPGDNIKIQDAVLLLYRFAASEGYQLTAVSAPDAYSSFSSYARSAAAWAVTNGIIKSSCIGTAEFTRGDAAKLLYGFYKTYQKEYYFFAVSEGGFSHPGVMASELKRIYEEKGIPTTSVVMYSNSQSTFVSALNNQLKSVKAVDVCHVFIMTKYNNSTKGAKLFIGFSDYNSENSARYLGVDALKNTIGSHKGTFVLHTDSVCAGYYRNALSSYGGKITVLGDSSSYI